MVPRSALSLASLMVRGGPVTEIAADPVYVDVELNPSATFTHHVPAGHTGMAYVFDGKGFFNPGDRDQDKEIEAVRMVVFGEGNQISVQAAPDSKVRFLLMAGARINEAIAPYGPFVMNTEAEIRQAFEDLRSGTFVKT
jgi:hypothetical protein